MNIRYCTYRLFKNMAITSIYLVILNSFAFGVQAADLTSGKSKKEISNGKAYKPVSDKVFIIEPNIKRSPQEEPGFDSSLVQVTPYIGLYKIDGFGAEKQRGVRIAIQLPRHFFVEFAYGLSEIDESTRTDLGFLPLVDSKELDYYDLSLGYNMLRSKLHCKPCGNRSLNTDFYLMAGFGNINIDTTPGNDISDKSVNFGFGLRAAVTKQLYINTSIKNQIMTENLLDNSSSAQNLSYDLGLGIYF